MDEIEKRARELLAAEFETWGQEPPRSKEWTERANAAAKEVREQDWALIVSISTSDLTKIALRAIHAALSQTPGGKGEDELRAVFVQGLSEAKRIVRMVAAGKGVRVAAALSEVEAMIEQLAKSQTPQLPAAPASDGDRG